MPAADELAYLAELLVGDERLEDVGEVETLNVAHGLVRFLGAPEDLAEEVTLVFFL